MHWGLGYSSKFAARTSARSGSLSSVDEESAIPAGWQSRALVQHVQVFSAAQKKSESEEIEYLVRNAGVLVSVARSERA